MEPRTTTKETTHVGGSTYGDGEYVVEFSNVRSAHAPLKATVFGGELESGSFAEVQFPFGTKPSVKTAAATIDLVRATALEREAGGITPEGIALGHRYVMGNVNAYCPKCSDAQGVTVLDCDYDLDKEGSA